MVFVLFSGLVFVSLLLEAIDKAMHSLGPTHGYIIQNGTLPNPMDTILVYAQVSRLFFFWDWLSGASVTLASANVRLTIARTA